MEMEEGLDTGPMLLMEGLPIEATDTTGTLHDKVAALGARMIVEALHKMAAGQLVATPQPDVGVTYAAKITKEEAKLDFTLPAGVLARKIRAFNPFPGANGVVDGVAVKIWHAETVDGNGTPGQVLQADAGGIVVACGSDALRLTELQKPGGKRLAAAEFLKGFALTGLQFS